jgi:hypothetical protein
MIIFWSTSACRGCEHARHGLTGGLCCCASAGAPLKLYRYSLINHPALLFLNPANSKLQYPVITAHTADREAILHRDPTIITASSNRHVLQPTRTNKKRRKSQIKAIQANADKGKHRDSSVSGESSSKAQSARPLLSKVASNATSSSSAKSDRSQLVDLVVEDHAAEAVERVRARKEGGSEWNEAEPKHFV